MYLVTGTRPDLVYTVSKLAQYGNKLTKEYMGAPKRVLRYLKKTRDTALTYLWHDNSSTGLQLNTTENHSLATHSC